MKNSVILASTISLTLLSACANKPKTAAENNAEKPTTSEGFSYKAFGNEPDWTATVDKDNTVTYTNMNHEEQITLKTERSAYAKGVTYTGVYKNQAFELDLNGQACNDTMVDKRYDMTASLSINGEQLEGCAEVIGESD